MNLTDLEFDEGMQFKLESELILTTINGFIDEARGMGTPNMTALVGALIESLVATMADNTDPDTALYVVSQIMMRLGPRCSRGTVTVMPDPGRSKH